MNQDFLNWQEAIHMLPLTDGVCTGKGRGWWRLVDLACPDKNIVWWALLSVFRAWDGHSSTPVRPPWQWLALSSSFPGPLCRWPACWRCQWKSGCSPSHNHSLASALICPLYFHKKNSWKICMAVFMFLHYSPDYQEQTCQRLCSDECFWVSGDAIVMLLLSHSYWHGQHLIVLIK